MLNTRPLSFCAPWFDLCPRADDITGGSGRNLTVTITEGAEVGAGAHVELLPETSGARAPRGCVAFSGRGP